MSRALMMGDKFVDTVYEGGEQNYGRNLLLNSKDISFNNSSKGKHLNKDAVIFDSPFSSNHTSPAEKMSVPFEVGVDYTISFLVTYEGTKGDRLQLYSGGGLFTYTQVLNYKDVEEGKFTRVYASGTGIRKDTSRLHLTYTGEGKLYATDFKIERGTQALPWSPAPEDLITPKTYGLMII